MGAHLRHYHDAAKCAAWFSQPRTLDEEIEITWAAKGHPVLLWEAHVMGFNGSAVLVKYDGFDDACSSGCLRRNRRASRPRRAAWWCVGHAAARMGVGGAP